MARPPHLLLPLFAALALLGNALAQRPDRPARLAAEAPAQMLATERFLFVLRGDVLHQFDVATLELLNVTRLPTGADLTAALGGTRATGRSRPEREGAAVGGRYGGGTNRTTPLTRAIDSALDWLAAHQDDDGKWDSDGFMKHDGEGDACDGAGNPAHDVGVTGMALLSFLAAGNTPTAGPHRDAVKKACDWLVGQQDAKTGLLGTNTAIDFIYDHAIAAFALVEAFGLSGSESLKQPAQQAVDYIQWHRNPYGVWRYQPQSGDNDTSVTSWCATALVSAKSFGLKVDQKVLEVTLAWLDQVTDPATGRVAYVKPGEPQSQNVPPARYPRESNEAMTGAGLLLRYFLGQSPDAAPVMQKHAELLVAKPPRWEDGSVDSIAWLNGTRALYQYGGEPWMQWKAALVDAIVPSQRQDGHAAGSWDAVGVWSNYGGRVFTTAALAQSLQVTERYSRLVRDR